MKPIHETDLILEEAIEKIVDFIPPSKLVTREQSKEKVKQNILEQFNAFEKSFHEAFHLLVKELIHRKIISSPNELIQKDRLNLIHDKEALRTAISKGEDFQKIFGFSENIISEMYMIFLDLFGIARYEECLNIALFLTTLNPQIQLFWSALGISLIKLNRYFEALEIYKAALYVEPESFELYKNAVHCCLVLNDIEQAKKILEMAIKVADADLNDANLNILKIESTTLLTELNSLSRS